MLSSWVESDSKRVHTKRLGIIITVVSRDQVCLTAAAIACGRQSQSLAVASVFTPSDSSNLDSTDSEMFRILKADEKLTRSFESQCKSVHIGL
jgi:hypothetical protein